MVLEPPFGSEDPLDSKGYWLRSYARRPKERVRIMRKQAFTSLVSRLVDVVRWGPEAITGSGQGGLIVGLVSVPWSSRRLAEPGWSRQPK